MSLKAKAKERIKRHQRRMPQNARLRDKLAAPLASSTALKLIRDAYDRTPSVVTREAIKKRLDHMQEVDQSETLRASEIEKCAASVEYWIDNYLFTYDPRVTEQPYLPFDLWTKQRGFIEWLATRERLKQKGVVEKSRDAGASWLCLMVLLHHWLFRPGFSGAVGSRKEDLVDELGNADSLFEKLRIALRMMPDWMLPRGLKPKIHCGFMKFINPQNGASITGEAGDNIGRGGRSSFYLLDEAAFIQRPLLVERALSANADVVIYVSTPNGIGNVFYKKRFSKKFPVFTFNWKEDPRKNGWLVVPNDWHWELHPEGHEKEFQIIMPPPGKVVHFGFGFGPGDEYQLPDGYKVNWPWYESKKIEYETDPVTLAQEVDIDYSASAEGITIPAKWVRAAVNLKLPKRGQLRGALDVADEGGAKNALSVMHGPVVVAIYHWLKGNTTRTAWRAIALCEQHGASEFVYDSAGGYGAGIKGAVQTSLRPIRQKVKGVNVGSSPSATVWDDGKQSKDKFINLKAELWWLLRRRFEKTYECVEDGIEHPLDELISIPNDPELIAQLSIVQHYEMESGKVKIETKDQLKKRGVSSPDLAECLVLQMTRVSTFDAVAGGESVPSAGDYHGGGVSVINRESRMVD